MRPTGHNQSLGAAGAFRFRLVQMTHLRPVQIDWGGLWSVELTFSSSGWSWARLGRQVASGEQPEGPEHRQWSASSGRSWRAADDDHVRAGATRACRRRLQAMGRDKLGQMGAHWPAERPHKRRLAMSEMRLEMGLRAAHCAQPLPVAGRHLPLLRSG